jgi:hypothetical protein
MRQRISPVKQAKGVTPLGESPKWLKIDQESGWHGTVRPLPEYCGGGYIAYISKKREFRQNPKVHEGKGTTPVEALRSAWEEATPLEKQAAIRDRVGWTNNRVVQKWLKETETSEYFEPGNIDVPTPSSSTQVYVWYEEDYEERKEKSDGDNYIPTHYHHSYQFLAVTDIAPPHNSDQHVLSSSEVPLFEKEGSEDADGYAVVAFADEHDYYDFTHNKADVQGVFNDLEDAEIYAGEMQALQSDIPGRSWKRWNSVEVFPLGQYVSE